MLSAAVEAMLRLFSSGGRVITPTFCARLRRPRLSSPNGAVASNLLHPQERENAHRRLTASTLYNHDVLLGPLKYVN